MARPKGSPSINKTQPPRGRAKGSLDRSQRTLISNELAADILNTYRLMTYKGATGTMALLKWSEDNPAIFYTQILSRLFPPPMKEAEDPLVNIQIGEGVSGEIEMGRRIAFALAKAAHLQGEAVGPQHTVPYSQFADQPLPTRPSWMPQEDDGDE